MVLMNIINIYENYNEREREAKNKFLLPNERVTTVKPCYNSYFNADLKAIFEQCSKIAFKSGYKLYLIGGMVRDLLLNQKSLDIDITVEGDAIKFAKILEQEIGAKISSVHQNFGTVKVEINGKKIDFASTRSESYPKPGHLPHVDKIGCSLKEDVLRRDFTINSLAISLNQENFADLIDYVGGFEDLKTKKIRILHDKSFIDDPTRIIRALKYTSRLNFELEENTLKLQKEYLKNINYDMGYKRVKQEFKKTFEQNTQKTFEEFIKQKIYKLIIKKEIKKPKINIENLINKYKPKHPWLVYLGIIVSTPHLNPPPQGGRKFPDKLELTKYEKGIIEGAESLKNNVFTSDFEIYKAFSAQKLETLLILAVLGKEKNVFHYLDNLQKIKLSITGNDILKLGFTPSKAFGEGFDYVLKEKLKRPNMTKAEELDLMVEWFNQVPR